MRIILILSWLLGLRLSIMLGYEAIIRYVIGYETITQCEAYNTSCLELDGWTVLSWTDGLGHYKR